MVPKSGGPERGYFRPTILGSCVVSRMIVVVSFAMDSGGLGISSMEAIGYESGFHIRFPRNAGRAPLPDAQSDDTGQSSRNTGGPVHLDLPVNQLGWIPTSLQIVVGLDVMEVGMRHDERDHRDRQDGDGGVIDTLRA